MCQGRIYVNTKREIHQGTLNSTCHRDQRTQKDREDPIRGKQGEASQQIREGNEEVTGQSNKILLGSGGTLHLRVERYPKLWLEGSAAFILEVQKIQIKALGVMISFVLPSDTNLEERGRYCHFEVPQFLQTKELTGSHELERPVEPRASPQFTWLFLNQLNFH